MMRPELAGQIVHVKPLTSVHHLSLKWDLDSKYAHMRRTDPGRLATTVLSDNYPNSLVAYLRKEHLATSLSSGLETSGRDNAQFAISITLSEKGMKQMNEVVGLCFRAIHTYSTVD